MRQVHPASLLCAAALLLAGCAQPPHPARGRHLQLQTLRHDYQTTYVYREVADSPAPSPR
jgi:starvation-inducible outer membrane lipoprotein